MEAEIKNYLKFIRRMGIKAWIPGLPGSAPKMSVTDQCRSGVLCLNFKGSDIYIQGNSRRAKDDGQTTSTGCSVCENPDHARSVKSENDEFVRFDGDLGGTAPNDDLGVSKTSRVAAAAVSGRDVGTQWSYNDIVKPPKIAGRFFKNVESSKPVERGVRGTQRVSKQHNMNTFVPENTGVQYRRIVTEKLTREVRVAKCYVSSLPNLAPDQAKRSFCHLDKRAMRSDYAGKLWSNLDSKHRRSPEIEKSGLSPGFVRQLINRFDVYDNVEQPRPSRETLYSYTLL